MGFPHALGFTIVRFCEFYYKCILHLNLRLAITRCTDDFINYSTSFAEDLMRWSAEYLRVAVIFRIGM